MKRIITHLFRTGLLVGIVMLFPVSARLAFADTLLTGSDGVGQSDTNIEYNEDAGEAPVILTTSLPDAKVGQPYSFQIEVSGTAPFTFSWGHGRIVEASLSMDKSTGLITGTPLEGYGGRFVADIQVTNAYGYSRASLPFNITDDPPVIKTKTLPDAFLGDSYYQPILIDNCTLSMREIGATLVDGSLDWLSYPGEGNITGFWDDYGKQFGVVLRGDVVKKGTFTFTLQSDNGFGTDEQEYTITVRDREAEEDKQYTVTFRSDGSIYKSSTVEDGSTVSKPTDPIKTGYSFAGWYLDENCTVKYDFSNPVNSDMVLYTKWTENSSSHNMTIGVGTKLTLKAKKKPAVVIVSDESVVKVKKKGKKITATGKSAGSTTVTAYNKKGKVIDTWEITVE